MKIIGCLVLLLFSSLSFAQSEKIPPFSGTWTLNMQRSKVEASDPPVSSEAIIVYDGKTRQFKRTHKYATGKRDTWTAQFVVDSPKFRVAKEGPFTFRSRLYRDGYAIVLVEDVSGTDGQKGKNTVRYTLEDDGNTLIEFETEETPDGRETNRWVLERKTNR